MVLHCPAAVEERHTVAGIIIQIIGPEDIAVSVNKFYQMPPELGSILRYDILDTVAGEDGVLLLYPHAAYGIDEFVVHVPVCTVTVKIGVIVQEYCVADHLTVFLAVDLYQSCPVGGNQPDQ